MEIRQGVGRDLVLKRNPSRHRQKTATVNSISEALDDAIALLAEVRPSDIVWEVDDVGAPALFMQDARKRVSLYVGFPSIKSVSEPFVALIQSGFQRFRVCNFADESKAFSDELIEKLFYLEAAIQVRVISGLQKALAEFGFRLLGVKRALDSFDSDDAELATLDSSASVDDLVRVPADANVAVEVKSTPDTGDDEDSGIDLPQQRGFRQFFTNILGSLLKRQSENDFVEQEAKQEPEEEQAHSDNGVILPEFDALLWCFDGFKNGSLRNHFSGLRDDNRGNLNSLLHDLVWYSDAAGEAFECEFGSVKIIIELIEGQRDAISEPVTVYSIHARYGPYVEGMQTQPIGIVPDDDRELDFPLCVLYRELRRCYDQGLIKEKLSDDQKPLIEGFSRDDDEED